MSDNPILDSETPAQERIQDFTQESRANIPEHVFRSGSPNQPDSSHKAQSFDEFDEIQKPFNSAELDEESTAHAGVEIETSGYQQ